MLNKLTIWSPTTVETRCALRKRHDQNSQEIPSIKMTGEDLDSVMRQITEAGWSFTKDGPAGFILFFCPVCAKHVRFNEDGSVVKNTQGRIVMHPAWEDMTPEQRLKELRKRLKDGDSLEGCQVKNKGGRPKNSERGGGFV